MVVELEERTLEVVSLADIAGVAFVEDGGVNTVKESTQNAHTHTHTTHTTYTHTHTHTYTHTHTHHTHTHTH